MPSSQTELEHAIMTIVKCFFDHAGEEGKKETLSINEFIKLTQMELPHLMKDIYLEKMMDLGNNQDSDINFKKFWSLISKKVERDIKPMK